MYSSRTVIIDRGNYTSCTVNLTGATITSWRVRQIEQIFMSAYARIDGKSPIVGGIPIIFPQLGDWAYGPHHGFARVMDWKLTTPPTTLDNRDVTATFLLEDDDYSRSMWNYPFRITYKIILGERNIILILETFNTGNTSFYTHVLLNPFIRVPNVKQCNIAGLVDSEFDELDTTIFKMFEKGDKIYAQTKKRHIISNVCNNKNMKLKKENSPDTVVWSPGEKQPAHAGDTWGEDYLHMICMATGIAAHKAKLEPDNSLKIELHLKLSSSNIPEYKPYDTESMRENIRDAKKVKLMQRESRKEEISLRSYKPNFWPEIL